MRPHSSLQYCSSSEQMLPTFDHRYLCGYNLNWMLHLIVEYQTIIYLRSDFGRNTGENAYLFYIEDHYSILLNIRILIKANGYIFIDQKHPYHNIGIRVPIFSAILNSSLRQSPKLILKHLSSIYVASSCITSLPLSCYSVCPMSPDWS